MFYKPVSARPRGLLSLVCALGMLAQQHLPAFQQAQADAPQKFKINVIRGDNAQNRVTKGRATSQTVVEVRDENNVPVAGIALTFTLPALGASGTFTSGGVITTVVTNAAGQASVSFTPNAVAGSFSIGVSGTVQGQVITTSIAQTNLAAGAAAGSAGAGAGAGGGMSGTTIGIIVAVVAAAAVGGALAATGGKSSSPAASPTPVVPAAGLKIGIGGPVVIQGR